MKTKKRENKNALHNKSKSQRKIKQYIQGKRLSNKNGWIRIKIYGNAFERGFAHGFLLAKELREIYDAFPFILKETMETKYKEYKTYCKNKITPNIQAFFPEFFEEIQGISAGAISAGCECITVEFFILLN
jgi:hypothetical protein